MENWLKAMVIFFLGETLVFLVVVIFHMLGSDEK